MAPVQTNLQDMTFTHWPTTNAVLVWNDILLGVTAILEACAVQHSRQCSLAESEFSWIECVQRWSNLRTLVWTLLWNVSFISSSLIYLSFFPLSLSHHCHLPSFIFLLIIFVLFLSVTFKQLVNVIHNSPPCYVALLHSFSVKIHMSVSTNTYRVESHVDMAFTYNT